MLGMQKISRNVRRILQSLFTNTFIANIHEGGDNLNQLLVELNNLMRDFNDKETLKEVINALRTFVELGASMSSFIALLGKILPYGIAAQIILNMIASKASSKDEKDQKIVKLLTKLLEVNAKHLGLTANLLEQAATQTLILQNLLRALQSQPPGPEDAELINRGAQKARRILSELECSQIQESVESILKELYQEEMKNMTIDEVLDGITVQEDYTSVIDYLVKYHQQWSKAGQASLSVPNFSPYAHNYSLIKKLYNLDDVIDQIMQSLVLYFRENGGDDLYHCIADNQKYKGWHVFATTAKEVTKPNESFRILEQEKEKQAALSLTRSFLSSADLVQTKWSQHIENRQGFPDTLPLETRKVIVYRAYSEFVKITIPYYFTPYMIPRETWNGIKDVPKGYIGLAYLAYRGMTDTWNHGFFKTAKAAWDGVISIPGNLKQQAVDHPWRLGVSLSVNCSMPMLSTGLSAAAGKLAGLARAHSPAISAFNNGLLQIAENNLQYVNTPFAAEAANACLAAVDTMGIALNNIRTSLGSYASNPQLVSVLNGIEAAIEGAKANTASNVGMPTSAAAAQATSQAFINVANWFKLAGETIEAVGQTSTATITVADMTTRATGLAGTVNIATNLASESEQPEPQNGHAAPAPF